MSFRKRIRLEILEELHNACMRGEKEISVHDLAKAVGVRWETVERSLNQLAGDGYVIVKKLESFPFKKVVTLTEKGKMFAKDMFLENRSKLGTPERLLLTILYAVGGKVEGATKLEKLVFLLEKEYGVPLKDFFKYFAYLRGPYSPDVMQASYILAYYNFIRREEKVLERPSKDRGERLRVVFMLTEEGESFAEELFKGLPDEIKDKLKKLNRFNDMTTSQLLDYVYAKYPEYKKYTKLDRFF